jgi:hypothetical protein
MKISVLIFKFLLCLGYCVNAIAQEKFLWNFECDFPSPKAEYDCIPRFPSKAMCESHIVKVDDVTKTDSVKVLKQFANENLLPSDAEIKRHLIAVANPFHGKPPVVWILNPAKIEVELVIDAFIVQWSKDKKTYYFLDANPSILFRIPADAKNFNDPREFVLKMFSYCLSKEISSFLPKKDAIVIFDKEKEDFLAGYLSLKKQVKGFSEMYLFYYFDGNFYIQTDKELQNLSFIEASRFDEKARFYNMIGGPEREWDTAEQKKKIMKFF